MEWWQIQSIITTGVISLAGLTVVAGVTLRFAIKPFLKDWRELRGKELPGAGLSSDPRLDRMEQQLEQMEFSINRLLEVSEFDHQLKSGDPPEGNR